MQRWVVLAVTVLAGALPGSAAAADCADPGVPGQYQIFARNTFTANTGGTQIPGRVAAGGNVHIGSITIGTQPPLTPDMSRTDLAVGGNLTVDSGGGQVPKGRVTYAGTLTASGTLTTYGGLVPGATGDRLRRGVHDAARPLRAMGEAHAQRHGLGERRQLRAHRHQHDAQRLQPHRAPSCRASGTSR